MLGTLVHEDATAETASADAVRRALAGGGCFWLDLGELDPDDSALLRDAFHFHELAVEDAEHFGQRPKAEDYDGFTFLVVHGAAAKPLEGEDPTIEVHCFVTDRYLVTVHRGAGIHLDDLRDRLCRRGPSTGRLSLDRPASILYGVVDRLVDSFFPVLSELDDRIDELEDAILQQPTDAQLGELFALKRTLVGLRRVVTPQRDLFATLVSGMDRLPGLGDDDERYFRDLYDHLIRISDLVDSYRDLLSGAMDTHLSTVSNRLNSVMKQLAIIATIFLPMSFLTGFFGQNFAWMVNRIGSGTLFWGVGIGAQVVTVVGLMIMFRRRGWLGST